jgi:hypothetical protein
VVMDRTGFARQAEPTDSRAIPACSVPSASCLERDAYGLYERFAFEPADPRRLTNRKSQARREVRLA